MGGPSFLLTISGTGFAPDSQVCWNGEPRSTTFLSADRLFALIGTGDIEEAQTALLTVLNPDPGGGVSASFAFLVTPPNPVPVLYAISATEALVGSGPVSITLVGDGFVPGATLLWNGEVRPAEFVDSRMLTASIPASDLAAPGLAYVSVANPQPGGGPCLTTWVFTIANPTPAVAGIDPVDVWAGGPAFTLVVTGDRFSPLSVVQIAGVDRPTHFVSEQRLEVQLAASDVAHAGSVSVRVFTPAPGGGLSAPLVLNAEEDDVPPVTTVSGLVGVWHRTKTTFDLVATDVGLGVEWTYYLFVGEGDILLNGPLVVVPAPKDHSNDGLHTVEYRSVDMAGNLEPFKRVQVGIDTTPPVTSVAGAEVVRGSTFKPRYRVDDATSPRALDAMLQVVNASGKIVCRFSLGRPVTGTWHAGGACRVTLPKGTYKMRVLAHDLAGNAQSATKSGVLTVY